MILITIGLVFAILFFLTIRNRKKLIPNYTEKCIFITGTDSGFGKILALALDKKGIKVYAGCYTENGLHLLTEQSSGKMKCFMLDVTDEKSILAAREIVQADLNVNHKDLWGLVNNAGVGAACVFYFSTLDTYKTCMDVNFFGAVNTTEIFLPLIKKSRGRIVNVISIARRCHIMSEAYTCSKMAMGVYNDGLRRYMKDYGIHVAGIEPGGFQTEMTNINNIVKVIDRDWQQLPEDLKLEYGSKCLEAVKKDISTSMHLWSFDLFNNPDTVREAITNALFSMNPKTSYICGKDANLVTRFGMYVPDFIMDFISRMSFFNTRRVLKCNMKNIQQSCD